jgi:hypothetical protein
MLSYRLSPEHRYPAALDDCIAAYRWLLEQGFDASRILIAGDSAGGNLTLALLLRTRDEALPRPAGAVALSPVADFTFSGDSVRRNDGVDDMFSADMMDALVPVYLADRELRTHPHVSPVFGDYTDLPPLLLVVGSTELLLDDSVRVAHRCPSAQLLVWNGMPHVFPGFDFLPEAREATLRIGRFMRECLAEARPQAATNGQADHAAVVDEDPTPAVVAADRLPPKLRIEALLYLALAVGAGLISLAVLTVWPGAAWGWANPLVWAATAVVVAFMGFEAGSIGWRRVPWCLGATLLLGPGCGLAVLLFLRALSR